MLCLLKKIVSNILSKRALKMFYYAEGCITQIENWSAELPYSFQTQYSDLMTTGFSGGLAMCYMSTSLQWKLHRNHYIDSILSENHPTFKWYIQGVCSTGKHVTYLKMSRVVWKGKDAFTSLSNNFTRFCWFLRSYLIASKKDLCLQEIVILHAPESPGV